MVLKTKESQNNKTNFKYLISLRVSWDLARAPQKLKKSINYIKITEASSFLYLQNKIKLVALNPIQSGLLLWLSLTTMPYQKLRTGFDWIKQKTEI